MERKIGAGREAMTFDMSASLSLGDISSSDVTCEDVEDRRSEMEDSAPSPGELEA
jgi:hypothetical protein